MGRRMAESSLSREDGRYSLWTKCGLFLSTLRLQDDLLFFRSYSMMNVVIINAIHTQHNSNPFFLFFVPQVRISKK